MKKASNAGRAKRIACPAQTRLQNSALGLYYWVNVHNDTKFRRDRSLLGYSDLNDFKMAAVRHLGLLEI